MNPQCAAVLAVDVMSWQSHSEAHWIRVSFTLRNELNPAAPGYTRNRKSVGIIRAKLSLLGQSTCQILLQGNLRDQLRDLHK